MIKSIKYFLSISLLLGITIASAINGIGNYLLDEQVIQPYLDSQLVRIASLIDILSESGTMNSKMRADIIDYLAETQPITKQKFLFQVWDKNNALVLHSSNQTPVPLSDAHIGFSDRSIDGNDWRIYSMYDQKLQVKIVVAELYN